MSVHTIQIKCDKEITQDIQLLPYVNNKGVKNPNGTYSYIINPNKYNGEVNSYAEYVSARDSIINCLEPVNPVITRIDYAINCYEDNFDRLYKLNKVLILLLCIKYNIDNRYGSFDLLTNRMLCSRVQKPRLEIENYNKLLEAPSDKTKNRLEFRSKQLYKVQQDKEYSEFLKWIDRINESVNEKNYKNLQNITNDILYQEYNVEKEKRGFNTKSYIYKYNKDFFTQAQLADFYQRTGLYKDPKAQARKYKYYNDIEYISLELLLEYANIIKQAGTIFFDR